ncbi:hypothetical protein ZEAMMB73_Zm00001d028657 [Zea mays]|uniref:Uncharacterized protein n=1 Tax=Zea mays TaxID=4577 RepID=A0A1D6JYB1_MAIZE|nr:hypothetical protein ZEAMMB73_Zm00001d028657 [Zea mays]
MKKINRLPRGNACAHNTGRQEGSSRAVHSDPIPFLPLRLRSNSPSLSSSYRCIHTTFVFYKFVLLLICMLC